MGTELQIESVNCILGWALPLDARRPISERLTTAMVIPPGSAHPGAHTFSILYELATGFVVPSISR